VLLPPALELINGMEHAARASNWIFNCNFRSDSLGGITSSCYSPIGMHQIAIDVVKRFSATQNNVSLAIDSTNTSNFNFPPLICTPLVIWFSQSNYNSREFHQIMLLNGMLHQKATIVCLESIGIGFHCFKSQNLLHRISNKKDCYYNEWLLQRGILGAATSISSEVVAAVWICQCCQFTMPPLVATPSAQKEVQATSPKLPPNGSDSFLLYWIATACTTRLAMVGIAMVKIFLALNGCGSVGFPPKIRCFCDVWASSNTFHLKNSTASTRSKIQSWPAILKPQSTSQFECLATDERKLMNKHCCIAWSNSYCSFAT